MYTAKEIMMKYLKGGPMHPRDAEPILAAMEEYRNQSTQPSKPVSCDAMGHYGANPTSSICPKCNQPFNYSQVGKEAIEFAEWIIDEYMMLESGKGWYHYRDVDRDSIPTKTYTTADLYKLFNPKWAEQGKQEAPGDEKQHIEIRHHKHWPPDKDGWYWCVTEGRPKALGMDLRRLEYSRNAGGFLQEDDNFAVLYYLVSDPTDKIKGKYMCSECDTFYDDLRSGCPNCNNSTPTPVLQSIEGKEENIECLLEDLEDYFDNKSDVIDQDDGTYRANEEMQFHSRIKLAQRWLAATQSPKETGRGQMADIAELWQEVIEYIEKQQFMETKYDVVISELKKSYIIKPKEGQLLPDKQLNEDKFKLPELLKYIEDHYPDYFIKPQEDNPDKDKTNEAGERK